MTYKANVIDIVFRNDKKGWTVASVEEETVGLTSAVGVMPLLSAGDYAIFEAEQVTHPDYGEQSALLLRAYATSVKAKGSEGTVAGPMLKEMGLNNIADGDSVLSENLTMEAILMADPDWIFVVTMGADQEGAIRMLNDALLSNPAWATLTAVREGRYVVLDRELFQLRPNGRWAEAYETLYGLIYEE